MISKKINGFLSLLRPINCFISFFSVFAIIFVLAKITAVAFLPILFESIFAAFAVSLVTGGGNAINDYYDIEIDKINKPSRPIPSKIITRKQALHFAIALFSLGLLFAFFVNFYAFLIALFNTAVLIKYSKIKQKTMLGNFIVAYLCGSVFLFSGTILMAEFELIALFFMLAFFLMLGREITKDIEDIEGDTGIKKTTATQFSAKHAGALSALTLASAIIVSLISIYYFAGKIYILAIFFADTILFYCIIRLLFNPIKYASECQRLEKLAVVIMLAGIFVCSL
ncbi:MAG: hypothetical protein DRN66_01680 [Candidatus Nanohalarchaeota archaeon]|nr:MAG: hypothetical protein DRN66_01680 [Candidatus Nanohaloarchaeota archaeon]